MKNLLKHISLLLALCALVSLGACNEFEPEGYTEVASMPGVTSLTASVKDRVVTLNWAGPTSEEVTGWMLIKNGDVAHPINLDKTVTTYQVEGQPMGVDYVYTVKVVYTDNRISLGKTVSAVVPQEQLSPVTNLTQTLKNRTVTLTWKLPSQADRTALRVLRNGVEVALLPADATECVLKAQPMEEDLVYSVEAVYYEYYASEGVKGESINIPFLQSKPAFLLLAPSVADLPDDDEVAAATWFAQQPDAMFVTASDLLTLDSDVNPVVWVMIDREGLPLGWENLPVVSQPEYIDALKAYSSNGGSLYLSNMATQLTVPLGIVPPNMAPTVFGNGAGGSGNDVWTINPQLGFDFKDGADQGFYDRTEHAIYKGLEFSDPNDWGLIGLPLIGPGVREDHNCLWDCNLYGKGNFRDVIENFENETNSLVLATWGHVRDHCVAGLVVFNSTASHGRCVANGFAAYEWNQNSNENIYQENLETLTSNILDYLK